MRIEAQALFRGECKPYMPGNFDVLLDGEVVKKVVEADDTEGWVRYIRGEVLNIEYGKIEFVPHWE